MATTSTPTITPYITKPASTAADSTAAASTAAASTAAASTTAANTIAPVSVNTTKLLGDIFKKSNVIFLLWFLAIYVVLYFIIGIFFNKNPNVENGSLRATRIFDGLIFLFLLLYIIITYANTNVDNFGKDISKWISNFKSFAEKPYSIFSVLIFIIVFYFSIYLLHIPMTREAKPMSIMLIESLAMIVLIILLIFDFFKYFLKIDLINLSLNDLIKWFKIPESTTASSTTASGTTVSGTPTPKTTDSIYDKILNTSTLNDSVKNPIWSTDGPNPSDEVFNIRNNIYTYDEAKSVCSIYGAKLATYDQLEQAYELGGEWCNYGWSHGQLALFPTQKSTWSKLQENETTKNKCGRPGVNGGYIQNKQLRFGVNCYGKKPPATEKELAYMERNILDKIPESQEDRDLKAKINVLKANQDKFLNINSFNSTSWSEF